MPEFTTTTSSGTQITKRTPPVLPALDVPCQAIVTTQIAICEPMNNGSWRLVTAFEDNYNVILESRLNDEARREMVNRIMEIKQQWQDKGRIISLENLLMTGRPPSIKTGEKPPSPVRDVVDNS